MKRPEISPSAGPVADNHRHMSAGEAELPLTFDTPLLHAINGLLEHPLLILQFDRPIGKNRVPRLCWANGAALGWMQQKAIPYGSDLRHLDPFSGNRQLLEHISSNGENWEQPALVPVQTESAELCWVECRARPLVTENSQNSQDSPGDAPWLLYFEDKTLLEKQRRQITRVSYRDPCTRLHNRRALLERLQNQPESHQPIRLTLFKLDAWDCLEMSLGNQGVNQLIVSISQRFRQCAEGVHYYLEQGLFALLEQQPCSADEVKESHIDLILANLAAPYRLSGRILHCVFRSGTARHQAGNCWPPELLLRLASMALQRGELAGQPGLLSSPEENELLCSGQLGLELVRLDRKIKFQNYYQPQICLKTGRLLGFEVLGRYQVPDSCLEKQVAPDRFFRLADSLNQLQSIDLELLGRLLGEQGQFAGLAPLSFSVNALPRALEDDDYLQALIEISDDLDEGFSLQVELTENQLARDGERLRSALWRIRRAGIELALDDFGSGFSNLHYLVEMPFNRVKMDRSLVQRLEHCSDSRKLLSASAKMCRQLNLEVLAEGVETKAQAEAALKAGCQVGQGFLWGTPAPVNRPFVDSWLQTKNRSSTNPSSSR